MTHGIERARRQRGETARGTLAVLGAAAQRASRPLDREHARVPRGDCDPHGAQADDDVYVALLRSHGSNAPRTMLPGIGGGCRGFLQLAATPTAPMIASAADW